MNVKQWKIKNAKEKLTTKKFWLKNIRKKNINSFYSKPYTIIYLTYFGTKTNNNVCMTHSHHYFTLRDARNANIYNSQQQQQQQQKSLR